MRTAMPRSFQLGECVALPDGRIGRVRGMAGGKYRVRVMRKTSHTHQFLLLAPGEVRRVACPRGWMSPEGYRRYLKPTLAKLRARTRSRKGR